MCDQAGAATFRGPEAERALSFCPRLKLTMPTEGADSRLPSVAGSESRTRCAGNGAALRGAEPEGNRLSRDDTRAWLGRARALPLPCPRGSALAAGMMGTGGSGHGSARDPRRARPPEQNPHFGTSQSTVRGDSGPSHVEGTRGAVPGTSPPPSCSRSRSRCRRIPERSRVSQEIMEADATLRGVRLEVGRLVA